MLDELSFCAGLTEGAEHERAAIASWLRWYASKWPDSIDPHITVTATVRRVLERAARNIEEGDHQDEARRA